jgi:hypothetical protein
MFGIKCALQGDVVSRSFLIRSINFYCVIMLCTLVFAMMADDCGARDVFEWLNSIFHAFWPFEVIRSSASRERVHEISGIISLFSGYCVLWYGGGDSG